MVLHGGVEGYGSWNGDDAAAVVASVELALPRSAMVLERQRVSSALVRGFGGARREVFAKLMELGGEWLIWERWSRERRDGEGEE